MDSSGRKEPWRNLIEHHGDAIGGPQVGFTGGKNGSVRLIDAQRNGIGIRGRLHAGQLLNGLQRLLLEGAAALFGISGQAQLERRGGNVPGLEAEVHLQSLLKSTQGKKRSGYKHKAERHLNDDEAVTESQAAATPARGGTAQRRVRVGSRSAPSGSGTKERRS